MRRILLTIRYDGTKYHGWQVQKNGITVQQRLQDAAEQVFSQRPGITGCSRTDAGVHALMYCCHFDTDSDIGCRQIIAALNAHLPGDIAVYECAEAAPDFHARYSCKGKTYEYRIYNGHYRDPFYANYSYFVSRRLDVEAMDRAARQFEGTFDFRGFCSAGSSVQDTVRTVTEARVCRDGDMIVFTVSGDGFLYNMVRIMAGTLVSVGDGKTDADSITDIILSGDRNRAGITLPAAGLFLKQVTYERG